MLSLFCSKSRLWNRKYKHINTKWWPGIGARDRTPELTKVKVHWKYPVETHWKTPLGIRWKSDESLEHAIESEHQLENATEIHRKMPLKSMMISEVSNSGAF